METSEITIVVHNLAAMIDLAKKVAAVIPKTFVVALNGDLGSGKTTFCRALLAALGYTKSVKSPTFTLVEPYQWEDWKVYHFDLYRLNYGEELEEIGIREYYSQKSIILIEWAQKAEEYLPKADIEFNLVALGDKRKVRLVGFNPKGCQFLEQLKCIM